QMHLMRIRSVKKLLQFAELVTITLRTPGSINQNHITIAKSVACLRHFCRGQSDFQSQANDVGVCAKLLNGCDSVRVTCDEADVLPLLEFERRSEFGHRRRLAHARRPDEGESQRPV